ncbi:MAG: class II SORL domain-containing protein [Candidatus Omnitrophica bacterium]|nr:class II SORL domain-containing protein [Candidatus Omnitrophota bacterium]MDD5573595.1 class II SORL domain-containing protein [Candidatus Omnitrophota bacterium]
MTIKDLFQSADWKTEKHVPVIDAPDKAKKGENIRLTVSVGREVPHPNKTEHHICWIDVFFHPHGEKFPYQLARLEFTTHGASVGGPDTSSVYTHPEGAVVFKTDKSGKILAVSYCNIHGLWENSKDLDVA